MKPEWNIARVEVVAETVGIILQDGTNVFIRAANLTRAEKLADLLRESSGLVITNQPRHPSAAGLRGYKL